MLHSKFELAHWLKLKVEQVQTEVIQNPASYHLDKDGVGRTKRTKRKDIDCHATLKQALRS
jgi:hypothetical protein